MRQHRRSIQSPPLVRAVCIISAVVASQAFPLPARAASPVVVQNEAGFEGLEEASVLYYPATKTFVADTPNFPNHVDEGGGMFRDILRNNYASLGWWDGDRDTTNTDRQRSEAKGIVGLGHQQVGQTFEYSFDFRTNPGFTATSNFDHIFQLKATNGDSSPPLATISLYKSGSGIQGRVDVFTDGTSGTPQNEIVPVTYSYTAGQWIHFDIRITPCVQGQTTGAVQLSVNGGAFNGITNAAIDLQGSTDFRPKFGFYRGISTTNGTPAGDSWVQHRTITGYAGTTNVLTWAGGQNNNTWDNATTPNFTGSAFNTLDQVNFTGSSNTTVNLSGNLWPGFTYVNSWANYTFQGAGSLTGGTLRKDGAGTLTLATVNSYPGLTDVRGGTLLVTGSLGNNTLVSLTGGTLKLGAANALGSGNTTATTGTQINGGTLDFNGFSVGTEPVSVQGAGVGGAGAIVNSGPGQTSALSNLTLTGNTTLGGTGRWDVRGGGASLSTGGNAFDLVKTGANQISFVGANVDPALAAVTVSQGILAFQTSTTSMGNPAKTVTVAAGAILGFYNTTAPMTKVATLSGGTLWAESGTGTQNTFAGPVTLSSAGGILDAGGALTGGSPNPSAVLTLTGPVSGTGSLTKNGPGTVTLAGANTYTGPTAVNAGVLVLAHAFTSSSSLTVNGSASVKLVPGGANPLSVHDLTLAPGAALDVADNALTISSVSAATLRSCLLDGRLFSSLADATHTLGYLVGVGSEVRIDLARQGDANLDGAVTLDDYAILDRSLAFSLAGALWTDGDFNYDGTVDQRDYLLIDAAYLSTHDASPAFLAERESQFGRNYVSTLVAAVPEPGLSVACGIVVIPLTRRRRISIAVEKRRYDFQGKPLRCRRVDQA